MLRIGDWCVNRASGEIARNGESTRVEVRTMRLLLCLANHAGEVVSIDDLLSQVWPEVTVSPDSVYQAVASLRRQLGDDPKQPKYIETVPRLGYRMVAAVGPWSDQPERPTEAQPVSHSASTDAKTHVEPSPTPRRRTLLVWDPAAFVCLAVVVTVSAILLHGKQANSNPATATPTAAQPQKSIAVLPFLDLTEGMRNEEFADGMTEELIDKLSNVPGLQVPSPTSSFYFKGKQLPVAEIARSLGVVYVLDGSVRKSGARMRIAARLVRADNGYVAWTETYDRPVDDLLWVQDDIAGEVTRALSTSSAFKAH
jgi:TolB-like protein/DNA-binding winged helix-turn-helix (wHTH) protein